MKFVGLIISKMFTSFFKCWSYVGSWPVENYLFNNMHNDGDNSDAHSFKILGDKLSGRGDLICTRLSRF